MSIECYINGFYIKNSSVERESGNQEFCHELLWGRSTTDISITLKPRFIGSTICKPTGLYTRSFCSAINLEILCKH